MAVVVCVCGGGVTIYTNQNGMVPEQMWIHTVFIVLQRNFIIASVSSHAQHSNTQVCSTRMASTTNAVQICRAEKIYSYKGVEYTFVDTVPEDLVCPICCELLDEAQQTPCGHLFCKKCLRKTTNSQGCQGQYVYFGDTMYNGGGYSESFECPVCRSKHNKAAYDDTYNDRRVKSLKVHCPNPPCKGTGPLGDVGKHRTSDSGCQHEKVKCPKGCGEEMTRGCLQQHQQNSCPLRAHCCRFCYKQGTYRNITTKHYETCERFPLPCPNKCGKQRIEKKEIEHHLAECPEQIVKCTYLGMGCQETVARRNLDQHKEERKDHHLLLSIERVHQLCEAMSQLYSLCEQQASRQQQLENQLEELWRERAGCYYSDGGYCTPALPGVKVERPVFCRQRKWLENEKAFPSMPWIIKVENFGSAKVGSSAIESKPFFTHPTGHQFCLEVRPSSTDRKHTSVFITPMAGPSDDYLQWPFKGRFQITILNQLADKEHTSAVVEMTVSRVQPPGIKGTGKGQREFISHADLQKESLNRQYLKDDCVYFRVELKPAAASICPATVQGRNISLRSCAQSSVAY